MKYIYKKIASEHEKNQIISGFMYNNMRKYILYYIANAFFIAVIHSKISGL